MMKLNFTMSISQFQSANQKTVALLSLAEILQHWFGWFCGLNCNGDTWFFFPEIPEIVQNWLLESMQNKGFQTHSKKILWFVVPRTHHQNFSLHFEVIYEYNINHLFRTALLRIESWNFVGASLRTTNQLFAKGIKSLDFRLP
jgi:hypothetical protein